MTAAAAAGPAAEPATLEARPDGAALRLSFRGTLDTAAVSRLWATTGRDAARAKSLILDLAGVTALDTSGAAFLLHLERQAAKTSWQGLTDARVQAVLDRTRQALAQPPPQPPPSLPFLGHIGQATVQTGRNMLGGVAFLGEVLVASLGILRRPWRLRLPELLRHLDEAGLRAFGLTALLGVLIGLILAFQSSIPMRQFGAEIFIPNLVGISLLRELGPLMAAVILSGRTGSAFAAELGTMTVNEEVDALRIMGIDPIAWLVLPRVLAALLVMPVLALLLDLAGLIGMAGVMTSLGFTPAAVVNQLQAAVKLKDLVGGLFKAAMFGLAIGLVGCRAGLSAGRGPRAVGDAATAAVVGGIVSIVLLDGICAVLFFRLGW
ncbi:ABC transporter inner membrane subunit [Siccirubricoccus deserti]|uniref:ABC transporter permease n=1 Tax=Siccirubricoccus deserti TaxID=2013562 RepID=A0A9X0R3K9_9PROT|nr:ABC transporter permease [Siccirubricoccus deserti]MBC4018218.1 ABC transporter permease [Siccirubricoccus deserti]GGC63516.1 ABC transporter inner membrane subunit [Siccirubricoccus deserti]